MTNPVETKYGFGNNLDLGRIHSKPSQGLWFKSIHEASFLISLALETLDLGADVKKDRIREVPPYTGFGTEEDSLTSCQGLEPRAPERDFFKFMHKDRLEQRTRLVRAA